MAAVMAPWHPKGQVDDEVVWFYSRFYTQYSEDVIPAKERKRLQATL